MEHDSRCDGRWPILLGIVTAFMLPAIAILRRTTGQAQSSERQPDAARLAASTHAGRAPASVIELERLPAAIDEYREASRDSGRRDGRRLLIEAVGLGVLVVTASLAGVNLWFLSNNVKTTEDSVRATRETYKIEQRAWVGVSGIVLNKDPVDGSTVDVLLSLANTGRTPGINVRHETSVIISKTNDQVVWNTLDAKNPIVVFPDPKGLGFHAPYFVKPGDSALLRTPGYGLFVRANMTYEDIFNCRHRTEVCAVYTVGVGWGYCEKGNSVDRDGC